MDIPHLGKARSPADRRRTSEANGSNLAHLLRQAGGIVLDAWADLVREEIRIARY